MSDQPRDPVAAADSEARAMAKAMLRTPHAALSFLDAETGWPGISRIAFGLGPHGGCLTFISALAPHHAGLRAHARCALMLGEPAPKGDPLTHPRLMLRTTAEFVTNDAPDRDALRAHWLKGHPKAALYIDFPDFSFVRLTVHSALLNGGFARAWRLTSADLGLSG